MISIDSNSDGMTTVQPTPAEVEVLVNLNLHKMMDIETSVKEFLGIESKLQETHQHWKRIRAFIRAGAISEERVSTLNEQILAKELKKEFRMAILENAERPKLAKLLEMTNISIEEVTSGIQNVLDRLIRSKKESHPDLKSEKVNSDESTIPF